MDHSLRWLFCLGGSVLATVVWAQRRDLVVEAESLLGSAKTTSGPLIVQEMSPFGSGWGGNAQLFWRPPAPIDQPIKDYPHLSLSFDVLAEGTYDITLHHTVAPDYGRCSVILSGDLVADIDRCAPAVGIRAASLGRRALPL